MAPNATFLNLPEEKKRRIEGAAADEFSDKGYTSASINAIVSRVGIAKGSIFQYFGDKKGLFLFIFGESVKKVKAYLKEVREATTDAPLAMRLEETLRAGVHFTQRHPIIYRLYMRTLAEKEIPFRAEILTSIRRYSLEYLNDLLETARDRGELRDDVDLEAASFIIDATMDRFLAALTLPHMDGDRGIYKADGEDLDRRIKTLCHTLLAGVTP